MNITPIEENGITVFVLDGRIDSEGAIDLDLALQSTLAEGRYKMVLDMAKVRYLNSAGLRTLADILTQSRENGGDLRLAALNPKVQRVFQIIGFDKFFQIYENVAAATKSF